MMQMRYLLPIGLVAACAACASRGPALHDVGQTTTVDLTPSSPPSTSSSASAAAARVNEVAPEGKQAGSPCGTDPLPIVDFDGSSTEITEPTRVQELHRLAECLNAAPHEKESVVLIGYTDVLGSVPANLELGLARAQAVMRQLMSAGVAPGRIVVASAGELQRPQMRWGLRAHRVEILIARGGAPRSNEAPIARGIDAEGLVPRSRPPSSNTPAAAAPTPRPIATPSAPRSVPPQRR